MKTNILDAFEREIWNFEGRRTWEKSLKNVAFEYNSRRAKVK